MFSVVQEILIEAFEMEKLVKDFYSLSDKEHALQGLHKLANNKNADKRCRAAYALGRVFSDVPRKQQVWNDLIKLTIDKDNSVRNGAFYALGSAFSHVPDKEQAWNDLHKLTTDEDNNVRTYANYCLGKFSIFRASQSENDERYKRELEAAIVFFEKAAQLSSSTCENPSQFCLPFYRSFHAIIFQKKEEAKEEVDKYLAEANDAVGGSKSKELLIEAVNNLANALNEIQNLKNLDLGSMKGELNFYRKYCENAAELMRDTEEAAPFTIATLRRGLPILDRNLKGILEEIQKKARVACKNSIGTDTEEIARAVNQEVKNWEIDNQEEMTQMIENLAYILEEKISVQPKNQYILGKIEQMKCERNLVRQYEILAQIIPLIRNVTVVPEETVKEGFENLQKGISKIDAKLDEMMVSLKPGPRAELVISMGLKALGSGTQGVITIPLKEIKYPEVNIDLERIKEEGTKLSELPQRFIDKIKGYLP